MNTSSSVRTTFVEGPGIAADLAAAAAVAVLAPEGKFAAGAVAMAALRLGRRPRVGLESITATTQRLAVAIVALSAIYGGIRGWLPAAFAAAAIISVSDGVTDIRRRRAAERGAGERALLVGDAADVRDAAELFARHPEHGAAPVATATPDGSLPTVLPGGQISELSEVVSEFDIDHVVVVSPVLSEAVASAIGRTRVEGVRLSVLPPAADLLTGGAEIVNVRGLPFVSLAPRRSPAGAQWKLKRVVDIAGAIAGLMVTAPVFLFIASAVWFEDRGPVFFRQERVGRNGRTFYMFKFRSMVRDAEARLSEVRALNEAHGPYFKIENDPRITRVGRWLRRFSVDELPQLINVLRGEMSLVGPRPCLASELAEAPELFEWRLPFVPGMTGLWQVAGRSWLPVREGLRMDLTYVEHWSVGLDLRILLRTAGVVLTGERRQPVDGPENAVRLRRERYIGMVADDSLVPADACDVSVVVVTHESASEIDACLSSVSTDVSHEVIVVDNRSEDGTADLVSAAHPGVRLIRKRQRDGFSANTNIGAVAAAGRYVLLLNPDARVTPGAIDRMVAYLDTHPDVGAVGPRLVYPDGSPQASARRFPTPLNTIVRRTPLRSLMRDTEGTRRHLMLDTIVEEGEDVDWLLGAALMVRREVLEELDGLDDGYRLYCEDIDFCWRLHERGWRVTYLRSATVEHDLGELTAKRFWTIRTWWHIRGMARFVRLHGLRPSRPAKPKVRRIVPPQPVALANTLIEAEASA